MRIQSTSSLPCTITQQISQMSADVCFPAACLQLLVKSPSQRLRLEKVFEHPWIMNNADPAVVFRAA